VTQQSDTSLILH